MATATEEKTSWLNRLLRGEMSAVETYEQAMGKCEKEACAGDMRHMLEQHREAASLLRQHVAQHGEEPSKSSGPWGSFAQMVTGTAKLFGTASTFRALKQGEEHGISEYESALADDSLEPGCRDLINKTLLPRWPAVRAHMSPAAPAPRMMTSNASVALVMSLPLCSPARDRDGNDRTGGTAQW